MSAEKQLKKVAIFGYFGAGNLGDEAVVSVLIKNIKRRHPSAEIIGICLNPENTQQWHGIPAFPLRRLPRNHTANEAAPSIIKKILRRLSVLLPKEFIFLYQSYKRLKGIDLVIVGGSGQLVDNEGGALNHPYNHFKWTWLARLAGAKFVFLSVGAGPLFTRLGKWFIKKSLLMASYRSFRDDYSKQLVENLGVKENNVVCPDQAFLIEREAKNGKPAMKGGKPIVGVAPIAYCDPRHWPEINPALYKEYVEKMAEFTAWLIQTNHHVIFFHTQVNGDDLTIPDIKAVLAKKEGITIREQTSEHLIKWHNAAFDAIAKTDYVVASRFHAIIFSYVMNRPAVGVSYDRKINNAMALVGQGDFALDIRTFTVEQLKEKFIALKNQPESAVALMKEKIGEFRKQLEQQYDAVLL